MARGDRGDEIGPGLAQTAKERSAATVEVAAVPWDGYVLIRWGGRRRGRFFDFAGIGIVDWRDNGIADRLLVLAQNQTARAGASQFEIGTQGLVRYGNGIGRAFASRFDEDGDGNFRFVER